MKKFLAILLALAMVFSFAACGKKEEAKVEEKKGDDYEPFTFIFAHDCGNGTPTIEVAQKFKALLEEKSGGKITVDLYEGGTLSNNNSATTISMLSAGDIQMSCINGGQNSGLWDVYKLPYLFGTLEEAYKSEESKSGQYMLDSLKVDGIKGLSFWDVGFRVFTSNKSFADVNDVKGEKMRIISSKAFTTFAQALGASAVSTSMGELYTALQQGLATCQENPLATICSRNLYEVNKFVTLTNHVWTYYILAANMDWWNSLPEAAQKLINEVNAECTKLHREVAEQKQQGYKDKITAAGGTIVELTDAQLKAWVEVGRSTHKDLVADIKAAAGEDVVAIFYDDLGIAKTW